ncbi:MAG TPA: hypothetical protein V6D47_02550 [Oscillatoriaceae cyanobacterium]
MRHHIYGSFALLMLLAGCGSTNLSAPNLSAAVPRTNDSVRNPYASAAPHAPLKPISEAAVRHLLNDVTNDACIWAVQYSQSLPRIRMGYAWMDGAITGSASLVGKGNLIKASYNRYVYRVPDDQVLVVNHFRGSGTLSVDGYSLDSSSDVHYVFGSGELVVLRFDPTSYTAGASSYSGCMWNSCYTAYDGLDIEGFTVSPSLLGGVSSMLANEAK